MLVNRILITLFVASAWLSPELVRAQESSLRDVIDREVKAAWEKEQLAAPGRPRGQDELGTLLHCIYPSDAAWGGARLAAAGTAASLLADKPDA